MQPISPKHPRWLLSQIRGYSLPAVSPQSSRFVDICRLANPRHLLRLVLKANLGLDIRTRLLQRIFETLADRSGIPSSPVLHEAQSRRICARALRCKGDVSCMVVFLFL